MHRNVTTRIVRAFNECSVKPTIIDQKDPDSISTIPTYPIELNLEVKLRDQYSVFLKRFNKFKVNAISLKVTSVPLANTTEEVISTTPGEKYIPEAYPEFYTLLERDTHTQLSATEICTDINARRLNRAKTVSFRKTDGKDFILILGLHK